jgi:RecA/RadA recombinase
MGPSRGFGNSCGNTNSVCTCVGARQARGAHGELVAVAQDRGSEGVKAFIEEEFGF